MASHCPDICKWLVLLLAVFAGDAFGRQPVRQPWNVPDALMFCGAAGQRCCSEYRGSAGVIGPTHCNVGLGCNIATNTCEAPCGGANQVCCDGPETVAAQGGPFYRQSDGTFVPRKQMCVVGACSNSSRRCDSGCGASAGAACCGPQPSLAVASCQGALACRFSDVSMSSGTCEACGKVGQLMCTTSPRCEDGSDALEDGTCGCSSISLESAPVRRSSPCWPFPKRKLLCFEAQGLRHSIQGSSIRPTMGLGNTCVEGAFDRQRDLILVDVDNPRIFDGALLTDAERRGANTVYRGIDYRLDASGGEGPSASGGFYALDTSGPAKSINAVLPRLPSREGAFGTNGQPQPSDLVTAGLRVGPQPLTLRLQEVNRRQVPQTPSAEIRIALNPDVLLVPVQVFSLYSDERPSAADSFSREAALLTFDGAADSEQGTSRVTDGDGNVLRTNHYRPHLALDAAGSRQTSPDRIWAACGIQFRLVNYTKLKVPTALLNPGNEGTMQTAVREMLTKARESDRFLEGPMTIFAAPFCSGTEMSEQGSWSPPLGQALVGSWAACFRPGSSSGAVLAHEMSHLLLGSAHPSCSTPDMSDNIMCNPNPGEQVTASQCQKARQSLTAGQLAFPSPR